MQNMPIDVARLGTCMCVVPPEPRINPETDEPRKDREGRILYVVGVSVRQRDRRRADVIDVVVPGEPRGVSEGVPVLLGDLVATAWEIDGRKGVSFRVSSITPTGPSAAAATPRNKGGDA